jgi:hypothetical protein
MLGYAVSALTYCIHYCSLFIIQLCHYCFRTINFVAFLYFICCNTNDLRKIGFGGVDWIHMAQGRDRYGLL